jgi:hypothetical protein
LNFGIIEFSLCDEGIEFGLVGGKLSEPDHPAHLFALLVDRVAASAIPVATAIRSSVPVFTALQKMKLRKRSCSGNESENETEEKTHDDDR